MGLFAIVVLPAGVLAYLALGVAERRYDEHLRARSVQRGQEASALERRIQAALDDAAEKARARWTGSADGSLVAFVDAGGVFHYRSSLPEKVAATAEEERLFRLARRGGEEYEFARGDPSRAVDAYAFYVPRVTSRALRAQLRFRVARAARKGGNGPLSRALYRELWEESAAVEEAGLSLDVLSGLALLSMVDARAEAGLGSALEARVLERQRDLSTAALAALLASLPDPGPEVCALLARRRSFEELVRGSGVLEAGSALAREQLILMGDANPNGWRPVTAERVRFPPLNAGEFQAEILSEAPSPNGPYEARPLPITGRGPPLAWLWVADPGIGEKRRLFAGEKRVLQALVGILLLWVVGTAAILLVVLDRKRRLADVRANLLSNVSHELKTPITSIRIFSEMMAEDTLSSAEVRRFGEMLRGETLRLGRLIEDLLDYAGRDRRERPLTTERVDLRARLERLYEAFAYRARESRVDFRRELPGASPPVEIVTNPAAVERVVLNLLDNALKYRREKDPWILLELRTTARGVEIRVADNGRGVPPSEQGHIFEEFYRAQYEDYGVPGTGLGLAISRRLAERLGGRLFCESRRGGGSTFTLELPRRASRVAT